MARNMRPETSRSLSTGPHPCGRLQSFGAARPLLRLSLALGPTVLGHTYIPRLQSEGPSGTRFAMAFMYSLSSANTSELSVIMRLRILATHRHCPTVRHYTINSLHQPTKPRRHKQRPATHHHGRGPCKCIFLLALNRHTHPARGSPFARPPLGFTPRV